MRRILPGFLVVLLVLTACAAAGGGPDPTASPDPTGSGDGEEGGGGSGDHEIEHPTGADEPILIVDTEGGFVMPEFDITRLPTFVLLGDGRVIVQGMQTLEFPGPALPALLERRLTADGIQAVLSGLEDTNLFLNDLDLRGAMNVVADAPDTLFVLDAGGRTVTIRVYGLGTLAPDMEMPGVPSSEVQAHEVLTILNDRLLTLDAWLPAEAWADSGWRPYEPEAFRLLVRDVTDEPAEGDLPEQVRTSPGDDDPAAFGEEQPFIGDGTRCGVVEGDAARAWLEALSDASQMTRWTDDGARRFSVTPRPILPHEDVACPPLAGT
jgi:hypothetical protein